MDVLATLFKMNTQEKEGYLSLSDIENTGEYIFKNTIKLKTSKNNTNTNFTKWIAYWEGTNLAVEMTVLAKALSTGYVKVTIIDKKLRTTDECGEYPVKGTKVFGTMIKDKFMIEKTRDQYIQDVMNEFENRPKPKSKEQLSTEQSQAYIDQIKEAWGISK